MECAVIVDLMCIDLILLRSFHYYNEPICSFRKKVMDLLDFFVLSCQIIWHMFSCKMCELSSLFIYGIDILLLHTQTHRERETSQWKRTLLRKIYGHTYLMGQKSEYLGVIAIVFMCEMCNVHRLEKLHAKHRLHSAIKVKKATSFCLWCVALHSKIPTH